MINGFESHIFQYSQVILLCSCKWEISFTEENSTDLQIYLSSFFENHKFRRKYTIFGIYFTVE